LNNIGLENEIGDKKYMSHFEFEKLISQADVYSEKFTKNNVALCYKLSMASQVDEIKNDKHLNMDFSEFIEAFARVAD
jgi:hypothetical protein